MTKCPTDEGLAAAVEKITAVVGECIAEFKAAAPALVQSFSDEEWAKLKGDEDRRRARTASADPGATAATVSDADAETVDLHDVAARLPALVKIKRDLGYRLPGSGRPLANIALTRKATRGEVMSNERKLGRWLTVHWGDGHPTWAATWIDLGRLRLIRCAPGHSEQVDDCMASAHTRIRSRRLRTRL